jgi:chitinase/chitin-binding protein
MPKRLWFPLLAVIMVVVGLPLIVSSPAQAHGWITSPPSRQDHCAKGRTSFDCGAIKYEPQSVEGPKGSRQCSGGSRFRILDSGGPWPVTSVGRSVTFQWRLTAPHRTSTWQYYVRGSLHRQFSQNNQQPPSTVSHSISGLPSGQYTILAVWNIADTSMAFYACVDVRVG